MHSKQPDGSIKNERIYREVEVKADIAEEELSVKGDSQSPSVLVYASASWNEKTDLFFEHEKITQVTY